MNTLMMRMENNDPSLFEDGDNRKKSDAPSPGRSKKRIEENVDSLSNEWIASSSSSPLQFSMGKTTTATKSKKKKRSRKKKR